MVLIAHCYYFSFNKETISTTYFGSFFTYSGIYGVKLFFVLSGFLITYLLIREQDLKGKIDLKNFYIRRTLRIWPLYFLVGIGGTIAGPLALSKLGIPADAEFIWENLMYVFCFGINFQLIFDTYNRGIVEILWSVCIEEQFYLLWAPLLIFFRKNKQAILILITLIGVLSPFYFYYFANPIWNQPAYFFTTSAFSMFGFGGILAYSLYNGKINDESFLYNKAFQLFVLLATICFCFNIFSPINEVAFYKSNLINIVSAVLFGLLIMQVIHPSSILSLEKKWLKEGGKISYGIYVYHTFVAQVMIRLLPKLGIAKTHIAYEFVCCLLVMLISFIVSYISYYTFESFFLRLKKKFE